MAIPGELLPDGVLAYTGLTVPGKGSQQLGNPPSLRVSVPASRQGVGCVPPPRVASSAEWHLTSTGTLSPLKRLPGGSQLFLLTIIITITTTIALPLVIPC